MRTPTTTEACPRCSRGRVTVREDVVGRTHHYPGHVDMAVVEQTCDCDLSEYVPEDEATLRDGDER